MGVLVAGVLAAYMSTVSTEMNWGASYIVNDLYRPFVRTGRSERHYVWVGRLGSLLLFALSMFVAYYFVQGLRAWFLFINSVVFAFILPLSWLRFFWWRLNIYGESAALIVGLPLSYIVWFPLGFSNGQDHAFWEGFLLLFGLGAATSVIVSLMTRPEPIETLREFHGRCRPPGLWGPVVAGFSEEARRGIRRETATDLVDCVLGVAFAGASIVAVVSPLGRHWVVFGASLALLAASGGLFIRRWAQRGVFRELRAHHGALAREET
jgi:Na+/proline symporter